MTLYDVVRSIGLREATNLKKQDWNIAVANVQTSKPIIRKLYNILRSIFSPENKLEINYDMSKKARESALKKQLGIKVLRIKYNVVNDIYESDDGQVKFPYIFEIAEIRTENHRHEIVSGLNSSVAELENIHNPQKIVWEKNNSKSCMKNFNVTRILALC